MKKVSIVPLTSRAMPTSRIAVWPASGTRVGLGSLIVPVKVGVAERGDVVADDVGVAGRRHLERALDDRRRRGVDDEGVVEVAAGIAVARGQRELDAAVGVVAVGEVLAVEGDALGVGDDRRAAAEEDQAILVGRQRSGRLAPRLMTSVLVALL